MLSFHKTSDKDYPIAMGYPTKECIGKPLFTVYFVDDYSDSSAPAIESTDAKGLVENERYRIQKEFALSKREFNIILDRVAKDEPVLETSSRTIKRAYLEIKRVVTQKLKTSLEFSAKDKVYLKPVYDTSRDRTNFILTLFASSGAGKSWMVNDLCLRNPVVQGEIAPAIHLFSSVGDDDPSYKPIKDFYGEKFMWHDPRDLSDEVLNIHSYRPKSILIFDDVDSISNKKVRKHVVQFRENLLEIARHSSLVIISTAHLFHGRVATQRLRNSSAYFVLYPRNSPKPIDDVLDNNFNMNWHQRTDLIKKLKREGRAQFIHMDTPAYIVNTKRVTLL